MKPNYFLINGEYVNCYYNDLDVDDFITRDGKTYQVVSIYVDEDGDVVAHLARYYSIMEEE